MHDDTTPATSYHTALTVLAQAMLLPAEEQVPWINRVAQLAAPVGDDGDQKTWMKMRRDLHAAVRKCATIAQQLAEQFEDVQLQNPASVRQLALFPTRARRDDPFMGEEPRP